MEPLRPIQLVCPLLMLAILIAACSASPQGGLPPGDDDDLVDDDDTSGDDDDTIAPVAALAKQLGFAPVKLGKFNEGGALVHARGRVWGPLIFQDLFKKEP